MAGERILIVAPSWVGDAILSEPLVGLLHHTLKEILAVRVQLGFDFGEVGPQLFGHDGSCLSQITGIVCRAHREQTPVLLRRSPRNRRKPGTGI